MSPMTRSRRASNVFFTFLGAASVGLVVAVLALVGVFDRTERVVTPSPPAAVTPVSDSGGSSGAGSVAAIYARTAPAVAFIEAADSGASGSGFLMDAQGHVVTNEHVVEGSSSFTVRLGTDGDALPAKLVGRDTSSDLAVLEIDPKKVPAETKPLQLASSGSLRPGDAAIAIGSPFGLSGSVTTGIISGLDREIDAPNGFRIFGVLQTDAAINPGNSGGPLLDAKGRVIGVNSQIASSARQSSGVGFAVPADTVRQVVPQLIKDGKIDRAYLGVSTVEEAGQEGAVVADITPGAPAADSDLRVGDRIVSFDGKAVSGSSELSETVLTKKPGETARLEV